MSIQVNSSCPWPELWDRNHHTKKTRKINSQPTQYWRIKLKKENLFFLKDPKPKKNAIKRKKKQVLHENEMKHNTMLNDGLKNNFN